MKCEICDKTIPIERLEALPGIRTCVKCTVDMPRNTYNMNVFEACADLMTSSHSCSEFDIN